ncbi:MAG TPA: protein kinase [Gemmataceae bacterium]|jgi:serine/threonine protein kinase|nr:protein kinase [Gemmataceae bacterium]
MPIQISCPNCKKLHVVDDNTVGATASCQSCRTSFAVRRKAWELSTTDLTIIGNRYQIRSELGRGAFGVALKAFDTKMNREVAVKMLLPEALSSADAVQRFLREANLLAELGHPNIVPIFDKGEHERSYYLVCKLVKGKTLAELLPKTGFADSRIAVGHVVTLCKTLQSVFAEHSILHRDVKPANMMLEQDHLYLMDFGMAACHDKNAVNNGPGEDTGLATIAGTAVGTPAYMPPEQAFFSRNQIGPWSDMYSAGAVLYHFLTGSIPIPWTGNILDIVQTKPIPPSMRRPGLDPALDAIVLKSLEKRPGDRYQSGEQFATALKHWLDRPTMSRPVPPALPVLPAAPVKPVVRTLPPPIVEQLPASPPVDHAALAFDFSDPAPKEARASAISKPATKAPPAVEQPLDFDFPSNPPPPLPARVEAKRAPERSSRQSYSPVAKPTTPAPKQPRRPMSKNVKRGLFALGALIVIAAVAVPVAIALRAPHDKPTHVAQTLPPPTVAAPFDFTYNDVPLDSDGEPKQLVVKSTRPASFQVDFSKLPTGVTQSVVKTSPSEKIWELKAGPYARDSKESLTVTAETSGESPKVHTLTLTVTHVDTRDEQAIAQLRAANPGIQIALKPLAEEGEVKELELIRGNLKDVSSIQELKGLTKLTISQPITSDLLLSQLEKLAPVKINGKAAKEFVLEKRKEIAPAAPSVPKEPVPTVPKVKERPKSVPQTVTRFTTIKITNLDGVTVNISNGDKWEVLGYDLSTNVDKDGTLDLHPLSKNLEKGTVIEVHFKDNSLTKIDVKSPAMLDIKDVIAEQFWVDMTGDGNATMSGRVKNLVVKLNLGTLNATNLATEHTILEEIVEGTVGVSVSKYLNVADFRSRARAWYIGNPETKVATGANVWRVPWLR